MTIEQLPQASWVYARAACKDIHDRERLGEVVGDGWTAMEFSEYARACHRRPGKDYATPAAYRKALQYFRTDVAQEFRRCFRERGCKPLPPRTPQDLKWSPGEFGIDDESPLWPFHPEGFVEMITQRSRAYFRTPDTEYLHPNAWAAGYRAYWREKHRERRLADKAAKAEQRAYLKALKAECASMAFVPQ